MKNKTLTVFQHILQGIGTVFVGAFVTAYLFSLPGNNILHGEQIFNFLLAISGAIFIVLVIASLVLSFMVKMDD